MKMRTLTTVLVINICLLLVFFLFAWYLVDSPRILPIFTSVLAFFNLVGLGLGLLDRKKEFIMACLAGFLVAATAAAISWVMFIQHVEEIRKALELNA